MDGSLAAKLVQLEYSAVIFAEPRQSTFILNLDLPDFARIGAVIA